MTILVTGSTGHVGRELVGQLLAGGHQVRAMTRRPADARLPAGVEVVYGDCEDSASLASAFHRVDRAFLMSAQAVGSAAHPTHDLALAGAASRAGVAHVVKLSVYDGGETPDALGDWHRQAEAAVTSAGPSWTLLRPGRFMSNALAWSSMIRSGDSVRIAFADRPAVPIDPADIAAVAAAALTTDEHHNVVHQLSGPEVLTPADELRLLAEVLGRSLTLAELAIDAAGAAMRRSGMSEPVVEAILTRVLGRADASEVVPTVGQIIGRPPRTFAHWATEHAAHFGGVLGRDAAR